MQLQDINTQIVSITQIRRDIDVLQNILTKDKDAVVMSNQSIAFVVVNPTRYQELTQSRQEKLSRAISQISTLRKKVTPKKSTGLKASDYIVKMRDSRLNKWKK